MVQSLTVGNILELLPYAAVWILLLSEGIRDFRKRQVSLPVILIFTGMGIFMCIPEWKMCWQSMFLGATIGGILLLLAGVSREQIGYGDGWMFVATGVLLGFRVNLFLLFFSFLCSGVAAGILFLLRSSRKRRIPFIPFMISGYLLTCIMLVTEGVGQEGIL